jgi:hypothetical protein
MANDKNEEETYSLIFSSLKHPIRRKILRMLEHRDLTFSEILEILAIDSGHLSYHLENLGELVTHTQDGKYGLSSFGTAAVKLMGGVEEYDARTTPSRSKAVNITRILSLAIALTLLLVSFYSMNFVTSTQTNVWHGLSNMPLALAQNQTFNYFLNFTQKSAAMFVGSPRGMLVVDSQFAGSINEWVEYYPQLEIEINQTYSLEFNHTYVNITLHDSKGNVVNSQPTIWGVDSAIGSQSGWIGAVIKHPDNYSLEVQNLGPDSLYANIGVYVMGQHLQKPLFYYGLAGLIMTSSYLVLFFAGWAWPKRRE